VASFPTHPVAGSDTAFPLEETRGLILGPDVSVYYGHNRGRGKVDHHHEQAQMVLTYERGQAEISWRHENDAQKTVLRHHSFCLIPPLVPHNCRWKPHAELLILYLEKHFLLRHAPMLPGNVLIADFKRLSSFDVLLWPLAEELRALVRNNEAPSPRSVASLGATLAARTLEKHFEATLATEPAEVALPRSMLERVAEYIERHLSTELSVAELAKQVGLSSDHFGRLFKRATGTTPSEHVAKTRTKKAVELLRTGNYRVSEVALEVGFCDQSHFNRCCRRFFGCSPRMILQQASKLS
jgi:AraC family transcriptional regulator